MYITHFNTQSTNDTYCMLRMITLMKSTMPFIEYVHTWLSEITLGWVLCKASNDLYSCFLFNFMSQKIYYHVCTIMMASNIHYIYFIYKQTYYCLTVRFDNWDIVLLRYHFIPLINGLKSWSNIFTPNHINLAKDILRRCIHQKTLKCHIKKHWRWCDNIFFADYCHL